MSIMTAQQAQTLTIAIQRLTITNANLLAQTTKPKATYSRPEIEDHFSGVEWKKLRQVIAIACQVKSVGGRKAFYLTRTEFVALDEYVQSNPRCFDEI
jgi:hypothetical protein